PSAELQLTRGESLADTARVLERYVAAVVTRFASHRDVEELAGHCSIPVINGLSDLHHPCQALADVFTLHEKGKDLKKLKLAWVGDGNNVCNSLMITMAKFGGTMTVASPEGCEPPHPILTTVKAEAERSGAKIRVVHDPAVAVEGADVVYTDTFVSMGQEHERNTRLKVFLPRFQVTRKLLEKAHPNFVFMHCLPAHRGEEVEAEVIDGPRSIVWDQAANRLHLQKSLLASIV
ncbi:MAG: ornithine carbamoyltransferase, partial [Candidatus Bathyarchaeia archaeon]